MAKVLYEKRNKIAYITLNRPEALNALDDGLNDELRAAWRDFVEDDSLCVGILTGAGRAFCAGADLKTFLPKWEKASMLDVRKNVPTGIARGMTALELTLTGREVTAEEGYRLGLATAVVPREDVMARLKDTRR